MKWKWRAKRLLLPDRQLELEERANCISQSDSIQNAKSAVNNARIAHQYHSISRAVTLSIQTKWTILNALTLFASSRLFIRSFANTRIYVWRVVPRISTQVSLNTQFFSIFMVKQLRNVCIDSPPYLFDQKLRPSLYGKENKRTVVNNPIPMTSQFVLLLLLIKGSTVDWEKKLLFFAFD